MAGPVRTVISWVCIIALIMQFGCAHTPPPPVAGKVNAPLGIVGIIPVQYQPKTDLDLPAKGRLAGAGRKSVQWMGKGALAPLAIADGCGGDASGYCGLLIIALSVVGGAVGGVAGGVAGAIQAESSEKVALDEEVIKSVINGLKMPETLSETVVNETECATCQYVVPIPELGPTTREEKVSYTSLAEHGIDTVLEVAIPRFALTGDWDINPLLQFQMDSRIVLVRTADNAKLHEATLEYRGSSKVFSEWANHRAKAFFEELGTAYHSLARSIATEVFVDEISDQQ